MLTKIFLLSSLFVGCNGENGTTMPQQQAVASPQSSTLHAEGMTIAARFSPPSGFKRVEVPQQSFAHYLRTLSLKPHGATVLLYDGSEKRNQLAHAAVINIDVGTRDLQQCADAVMRLRAEYLFAQEKLDDIHFNFTNGFRADFSKWAAGYRVGIDEDRVRWIKNAQADASFRFAPSSFHAVLRCREDPTTGSGALPLCVKATFSNAYCAMQSAAGFFLPWWPYNN